METVAAAGKFWREEGEQPDHHHQISKAFNLSAMFIAPQIAGQSI